MRALVVAGIGSLASVVALGCTTTKAAGGEEARTAPPPTNVGIADVPPAPIVQENGIQTTAPPQPRPPSGKLAIGDACRPGDTRLCGTKGRIAMTMETMEMHAGRREAAAPCEMLPIGPQSFGDVGSGCVKDDRVFLSSECMQCRIFSRWDMTGLVAEMTDTQLLDAQKRVGLPADPVLRTADAWRTAIAKAANGRRRQ